MRTSRLSAGVFLLAALLTASSNSADVMRRAVFQSAPSGAGMQIGDVIHLSKSADTSRSSTITPAVDPDLQVTGLPAGHYKLEMLLIATTGAGGFRMQGDMSGTSNLQLFGVHSCTGAGNVATGFSEGTTITCAAAGTSRLSLSGTTDKAAATGTLSVLWAQNTSNAAATVLESDSWLEVTRLN